MFRVLSLVAVVVLGWAAAILLLFWGLTRALAQQPPGPDTPHEVIAPIVWYIGLTLVPGAPAVAAWLAARYRWRAAAWVFGMLAGSLATVLGCWWFAGITQS